MGKRKAARRELINTGSDKRFVRREARGRGDRGDRPRRSSMPEAILDRACRQPLAAVAAHSHRSERVETSCRP